MTPECFRPYRCLHDPPWLLPTGATVVGRGSHPPEEGAFPRRTIISGLQLRGYRLCIEFDLNTVSVDLGAVPFDEVLDFRQQNLDAHKRYMLSVRQFAMELSQMSGEEREVASDIRQDKLNDLANDLRKRVRKLWRQPASFALTITGAAVSPLNPTIGAALTIAGGLIGSAGSSEPDDGVYSYLFRAHSRWGGYY